MNLHLSELLKRGSKCDCCGTSLMGTSYISSGINGGIYCGVACANNGPTRLVDFKGTVSAELARRGVKFLPLQCLRTLLSE